MKYERNKEILDCGMLLRYLAESAGIFAESDRLFRAQVKVLTILTNGFFNLDDFW